MNGKRRRVTFRLRTAFVVLAAMSLPLGWTGYSLQWIREREAARSANCVQPLYFGCFLTLKPPPIKSWPMWALGEHREEFLVSSRVDALFASRLFPEATILFRQPSGEYELFNVGR